MEQQDLQKKLAALERVQSTLLSSVGQLLPPMLERREIVRAVRGRVVR